MSAPAPAGPIACGFGGCGAAQQHPQDAAAGAGQRGRPPHDVVWAPVLALSCILLMLFVLLSMLLSTPFCLARTRRLPALSRFLDAAARLMGAAPPGPALSCGKRPISRAALRSLKVSTYAPAPAPPAAAAAAASAGAALAAPAPAPGPAAGAADAEGDCCAICFCEYVAGEAVISLPCRHMYHKECITKWLRRDACCPMCKADCGGSPRRPAAAAVAQGVAQGVPGGGGVAYGVPAVALQVVVAQPPASGGAQ